GCWPVPYPPFFDCKPN
nr:Chain A, PawS derived peptide 11 (PDP-11) [unidentified]